MNIPLPNLNASQREMLPTLLRSTDGIRDYAYLWRMCQFSADEIARLTEMYRRECEAHAANLKEQQKCEAEIRELQATLDRMADYASLSWKQFYRKPDRVPE